MLLLTSEYVRHESNCSSVVLNESIRSERARTIYRGFRLFSVDVSLKLTIILFFNIGTIRFFQMSVKIDNIFKASLNDYELKRKNRDAYHILKSTYTNTNSQ